MAKKLSNFAPVKLMEVKPSLRWLWWPVLLFAIVLSFACGMLYYHYFTHTDSGQSVRELQQQLAEVSRAFRQSEDQRRQLELLREIDSLSAIRLREVYNEALQQNAYLAEMLSLYKGVLEPEAQVRGLQVREVEVIAIEQGYQLRAVFSQLDVDAERVKANARIQIIGVDQDFAGELVILPLSEVSLTEMDEELELDFVIYQLVEAQLALPKEFTPVQIEVALIPEQGNAITRLFDWQLLE